MRLFIDTANIEEIKEAVSLGVISGVTTNPSLIAKEGRDFLEVLKEILSIVDGPVSAEVTGSKKEEMVEEAVSLSRLHKNVVIKIPMCEEGLKAIKTLSGMGIRTNATLIFSPSQALLAARAGASYVSPFIGRMDDISNEGLNLLSDIVRIFKNYSFPTEIIAASIRHPMHVVEAAKIGADIATVPYSVLIQMVKHPLTDIGIAKFLKDWEKLK